MTPPSRVALWLLERLLPPSERDAFIGDLTELADGRPDWGWLWVWKETVAAVLRVRTSDRRPRRRYPNLGVM